MSALPFQSEEWFPHIALLAFWCGYLATKFFRLATIRWLEGIILVLLGCAPVVLFLIFISGAPVSVAALPVGVVLVVTSATFIRNRKIGIVNAKRLTRVVSSRGNNVSTPKAVDDFNELDLLLMGSGKTHKKSERDEIKMPNLYRYALSRGMEIMPLELYFETVHGFVAIEKDADLRYLWIRRSRGYRIYKRILDVLVASLVLLVFAIPMAIVAIMILLIDGKPVAFRQDRLGQGGRVFSIQKFRTMKNVGDELEPTRLGAFLRRSHIDELPQFFNILRGEMSIIGPRPEWVLLTTPDEAPRHYWLRLAVRPGLTGWAQVNYRPSKTASMRKRKLSYDLYYIKYKGVFLDMLIILRTLLRLPLFLRSAIMPRVNEPID